MPDNGKTEDHIRDLFIKEGFTVFGMTAARKNSDREEDFRLWLAEGFQGSMSYLERHAARKFDPAAVLPGCSTILFAGLNYFQDTDTGLPAESGAGRISRYAWGRDYHPVMKRKLRAVQSRLESIFPGERWKSLSDASPISEKYYAARAGIGSPGKNCLLINDAIGSWFFIGEILTTAIIPRVQPAIHESHGESEPASGCPPGCSLCIQACPTKALYAPHRINASRCVSCLTIEYRGIIPPEFGSAIGDRIFGCDACQDVCPRNVGSFQAGAEDFLHHVAGPSVHLGEILSFRTDEEVALRFPESPLLRCGRSGLVRNACVAAGNSRDESLVPLLSTLSSDTDPVVAHHALEAVRKTVEAPDDFFRSRTEKTL